MAAGTNSTDAGGHKTGGWTEEGPLKDISQLSITSSHLLFASIYELFDLFSDLLRGVWLGTYLRILGPTDTYTRLIFKVSLSDFFFYRACLVQRSPCDAGPNQDGLSLSLGKRFYLFLFLTNVHIFLQTHIHLHVTLLVHTTTNEVGKGVFLSSPFCLWL